LPDAARCTGLRATWPSCNRDVRLRGPRTTFGNVWAEPLFRHLPCCITGTAGLHFCAPCCWADGRDAGRFAGTAPLPAATGCAAHPCPSTIHPTLPCLLFFVLRISLGLLGFRIFFCRPWAGRVTLCVDPTSLPATLPSYRRPAFCPPACRTTPHATIYRLRRFGTCCQPTRRWTDFVGPVFFLDATGAERRSGDLDAEPGFSTLWRDAVSGCLYRRLPSCCLHRERPSPSGLWTRLLLALFC